MEFALTHEQEQFAKEFRDYLKSHIPPEVKAEIESERGMEKSSAYKEFIRQMGPSLRVHRREASKCFPGSYLPRV